MAWLVAADGADGGASTLEAAVLLAKVKFAEINTRIRRDQQKNSPRSTTLTVPLWFVKSPPWHMNCKTRRHLVSGPGRRWRGKGSCEGVNRPAGSPDGRTSPCTRIPPRPCRAGGSSARAGDGSARRGKAGEGRCRTIPALRATRKDTGRPSGPHAPRGRGGRTASRARAWLARGGAG